MKTFVLHVTMVSADMDVKKCGRKRTYFFSVMKKNTKADAKRKLCKSTFRHGHCIFQVQKQTYVQILNSFMTSFLQLDVTSL